MGVGRKNSPITPENYGFPGSYQLPTISPSSMACAQIIFKHITTTSYKEVTLSSPRRQFRNSVPALSRFGCNKQLRRNVTGKRTGVKFTVQKSDQVNHFNLSTEAVAPVAGPSRTYETIILSSASVSPILVNSDNESVCAATSIHQAVIDGSKSVSSLSSVRSYSTPNRNRCKFCHKCCRSQSSLIVHLRSHTGMFLVNFHLFICTH